MGMDIHQLNISRETVRHHIGKLRDDYKDYLKIRQYQRVFGSA